MPDPKDFKDKDEWMSACMHQNLKVEGKPQDQSVAICLNMWRNRNKKKRKKSAGEILRELAATLGVDPGLDISKEPMKKEAPHYYIVNKTYQVVDEESAKQGDYADQGFEYEKEKFDTLRDLIEDRRNRENWVEWSSSHLRGEHEWLVSEPEQDYRTGNYTSYGLHIKRSDGKPLSRREIEMINKSFGVRSHPYVGTRKE